MDLFDLTMTNLIDIMERGWHTNSKGDKNDRGILGGRMSEGNNDMKERMGGEQIGNKLKHKEKKGRLGMKDKSLHRWDIKQTEEMEWNRKGMTLNRLKILVAQVREKKNKWVEVSSEPGFGEFQQEEAY